MLEIIVYNLIFWPALIAVGKFIEYSMWHTVNYENKKENK